MALLWDNLGKYPDIDLILIQCYSGWRPRELCYLRLEDIDLNARTFTGGLKTDAGKNRIVPIHPKIQPIVAAWAASSPHLRFGPSPLSEIRRTWKPLFVFLFRKR